MDGKMLARLGAIVFVAVAITATVIEIGRDDEVEPASSSSSPPQAQVSDPLESELLRCQRLGEAGPRDASCLRAWAESRRRFLAPGTTPPRPDGRVNRPDSGLPAAGGIADDPIRKDIAPQPAPVE